MSMGQENKMTEEYKPKSKEVLEEISTSLGKTFSNACKSLKDSTVTAGRSLRECGEWAMFAFGVTLATPYCIPTVARKTMEEVCSPSSSGLSSATFFESMGALTGVFGGGMAACLEIAGYAYLYQHDHAEVLAIPIATNVISGAYEIGRVIYRNAQQRLVERHGKEISDAVDGSSIIPNIVDQNKRD